MGWGRLVDPYGLVGGGVVGGAGGHAKEVLVCHALGKVWVGGDGTTMCLSL